MTKELYNLTISYIKAYCKYKEILIRMLNMAIGAGGIEYDKEKVQSGNMYENSSLIEYANLSREIDEAFKAVIKVLKTVSDSEQEAILQNIIEPKNRNYINIQDIREFHHKQYEFIKAVAKEIVGIDIFLIDERESYGKTEDG